MDYLLNEANFDPNLLTETGTKSNCLHLACKKGNKKLAQFLIENSKVNLRQLTTNGDDCLMLTIMEGDLNMIKYVMY